MGNKPVHDRKTTIRIAGCAAVGLAFWSGHPLNGRVWAVDGNQQAHSVRIDAVRMTARLQTTTIYQEPFSRGGRKPISIECQDTGPAVPFTVDTDPQLSLYG